VKRRVDFYHTDTIVEGMDAATRDLADQTGGYWSEHPDYPVEDWVAAVVNEDTRQGYWEWVKAKLDDAE